MKEVFLTTSDNIKIAVNHYQSENDCVLVICPGWFMTKDSGIFEKMSQDFHKKYDVISMDFRGHGKSCGFYTFTAKELFDLEAVVEYAKSSEFGYKKFYLCGFSLGGAVVLNYCAKYDDINKVIAVSPPADFMKIENRMFMPQAWFPTLFKKFEPKRWLSVRPGFLLLKKEKPVDYICNVQTPVLFAAGENDPTVFPWHTELLYNRAKCEKKYKLFKNSSHAEDLYMDFPEEFMQLCYEWLG